MAKMRVYTLSITLSNIYESLLNFSNDLINLKEIFSSSFIQAPSPFPDLSDLLEALTGIPAAPPPQPSSNADPKTLWAHFTKTFNVRTLDIKDAAKKYRELKLALAGLGNEDVEISCAVEKLDGIAQSVGGLHEMMKEIIDEVSFD